MLQAVATRVPSPVVLRRVATPRATIRKVPRPSLRARPTTRPFAALASIQSRPPAGARRPVMTRRPPGKRVERERRRGRRTRLPTRLRRRMPAPGVAVTLTLARSARGESRTRRVRHCLLDALSRAVRPPALRRTTPVPRTCTWVARALAPGRKLAELMTSCPVATSTTPRATRRGAPRRISQPRPTCRWGPTRRTSTVRPRAATGSRTKRTVSPLTGPSPTS